MQDATIFNISVLNGISIVFMPLNTTITSPYNIRNSDKILSKTMAFVVFFKTLFTFDLMTIFGVHVFSLFCVSIVDFSLELEFYMEQSIYIYMVALSY